MRYNAGLFGRTWQDVYNKAPVPKVKLNKYEENVPWTPKVIFPSARQIFEGILDFVKEWIDSQEMDQSIYRVNEIKKKM